MQIPRRWLFSSVVSFLIGACLPAQTLTEFTLPEGTRPGSIIAGPDGNLWFTDAGPDDQHWFYEPNLSRIGRITTSGEINLFPGNARSFHFPTDLTAGPDGNIWVIHLEGVGGDGAINRVTPAGEVTELLWTGAHRITAGPDGNLWFTDFFRQIGRMTPVGQVTYFSAPQRESTSDITTGSDGNLWFTYFRLARVGRMTPAGAVTEFEIPTPANRITTGPDGNLWFTEANANRIGRITPEGVVTEFPVPMRGLEIAAGPDGDLWFTQPAARIGRITTTGVVTEIPIPAPASGIAAGPDGNIWFTQEAGKIGRISLAHQPAIDSRILPVVGSTVGVGGSFFRTAVQIHNPTSEQMTGRFVYHASGESGASSDPALLYSLSPGQTQSIADLLPAMGRSGLGSADIEVTAGRVPTAIVRVFNDAGAAGTLGFTEEPMRAGDALTPEVAGALLVPADPTRFRFNLGVRTLEAESTATLTLRDASGAIVKTVSRAFPASYHEQRSAGEFLGVSTLPAGGSIGISIHSGSAIFYGATVDNTTGDPSLQVARPAPR